MEKEIRTVPYEVAFAAHLPILGIAGQDELRRSRVHVVGAGRIGTNLVLELASAGVRAVSINDPQSVELENLNCTAFSAADLGVRKVDALKKWFAGRNDVSFEPIGLPVESGALDTVISAAHLVVCCANTASARIATEEKALRFNKPLMQVGAFDGRDCLGGLIGVRLPANPWSACARCYLDRGRDWSPSGGLLSTVTSTLAAMAANMAIAILSHTRDHVFREKNLFYVQLETYALEPLRVNKCVDCPLCGDGAGLGV